MEGRKEEKMKELHLTIILDSIIIMESLALIGLGFWLNKPLSIAIGVGGLGLLILTLVWEIRNNFPQAKS